MDWGDGSVHVYVHAAKAGYLSWIPYKPHKEKKESDRERKERERAGGRRDRRAGKEYCEKVLWHD